jgi:hypothetical protein
MGGIGSSPGKRKVHLLAEDYPVIKVDRLQRSGALVAGAVTTLQWPDLVVTIRAEHTRILISLEGSSETLVQFEHQPSTGGGDYPLFNCPACSRVVRHLYIKAGRLGCRKCFRLEYASRHLHRSNPVVHQIIRLRAKLGAELAPFGSLPPRPRRYPQHCRYDRIVEQIRVEEAKVLARFGQTMAAVARRHRT